MFRDSQTALGTHPAFWADDPTSSQSTNRVDTLTLGQRRSSGSVIATIIGPRNDFEMAILGVSSFHIYYN